MRDYSRIIELAAASSYSVDARSGREKQVYKVYKDYLIWFWLEQDLWIWAIALVFRLYD